MQVLITGSDRGQLHWELRRTAPTGVMLSVPSVRLDITDADAVRAAAETSQPDVIINAAAYTAVDTAESEPDLAHAVNELGVRNLAEAARAVGAHMLHVSTDFVFGPGNGSPLKPDAAVGPVSVYGHSKLAGERALTEVLPEQSLIMRTAWVYSSHGNNFVKTMLRLMNERGEVGVIADQIGSPTWARSLAEALWRAAELKATGVMHWTGAGAASWYDFAQAILEEGTANGLMNNADARVKPLRTDQFPTPAIRPNYSVLELTSTWDALDLQAVHWREELRTMMREML